MDDIVRRLASACCRGWRQQSLVNELLVRPVERHRVPVPNFSGNVTLVYGETRLPSSSFNHLRQRLVAVGFVVNTVRIDHRGDLALVALTFPELKGTK